MRESSSVKLIWSLAQVPGSWAWGSCRRLLAAKGCFGLACGDLLIKGSLLRLVALAGALGDLAFGRGHHLDSIFPPLDLVGHVGLIGRSANASSSCTSALSWASMRSMCPYTSALCFEALA